MYIDDVIADFNAQLDTDPTKWHIRELLADAYQDRNIGFDYWLGMGQLWQAQNKVSPDVGTMTGPTVLWWAVNPSTTYKAEYFIILDAPTRQWAFLPPNIFTLIKGYHPTPWVGTVINSITFFKEHKSRQRAEAALAVSLKKLQLIS